MVRCVSTFPPGFPFFWCRPAPNRVPNRPNLPKKNPERSTTSAIALTNTCIHPHIFVTPFDRDARGIFVPHAALPETAQLQPADDRMAEAFMFHGQDEFSKLRAHSRQ